MIRSFTFLMVFLLFSAFVNAQSGVLSGVVTDKISGETLIGVNIMYAPGKGVVTDIDGKFKISVPYGTYHLKFSYVGYNPLEKTVVVDRPNVSVKIKLETETLDAVEIVADVAKARETPVAFSTIKPKQLEEELASQDLPMILNSTPGVYATQQGGGDGDARINIRGFNQRNIAVMLDGVPVNDMENGWVYWSNWFGLDVVTRSIQVQRGLGASKLALPSVGGTMNIITKGIDAKRNLRLKQEVGSDGFLRTSLGITTGQLNNGWGITFAGSYKQGNGWVDQTWTKGWFYYLRVDKKLGNHLVSFSTMGAPQEHGQRSYKKPIYTYDTDYATEQGIDPKDYISGLPTNLGLRYNAHWGYLTRTADGETSPRKITEKKNYYYKPMFTLRDFWNISDKVYMSNILYLSLGQGGGTGLTHTPNPNVDGSMDFQGIYDGNLKGVDMGKPTNDILRSSMNNHFWVGFLNTTDYKISKNWQFSGGIDMRYYRGEHYRISYDMLGAELYNDRAKVGTRLLPNDRTNPNYLKSEGDIILYHNDGKVGWGGLFGQMKYKMGNISAFLNVTTAVTGYQRVDYFKNKDLVIDGNVYEQAVGYNELKYDISIGDFVYLPDTFVVDGKAYTINSPEARTAQTDWMWIPSYTIKGGVNYNFTETQNVFINVGLLNKAPRFQNVYDNYNRKYKEINNEQIYALEVGYSYYNKHVTVNLNAYATRWNNKPADRPFSYRDPNTDIAYSVNINGMDALHMGVEAEIGWRITKNILSETVVSLGDWKWLSSDSAQITDDNTGNIVGNVYFDAKGLYVGDAAQTQLRESVRWQLPWKPVKGLYVKGAVTYFGKNYSQFDPMTLDPKKFPGSFDDKGNPKQSWRIPNYYTVDAFMGYQFKIKKTRINLSFVVLNLLNKEYISDAQNNDQYSGQTFNTSDARSATVFFGMGRRFMTSLSLSF
ncbi:MAG: hypothetical protein DSY76_03560 [Bacteroidetes bacterium]|nr:MAG: hypothetical protein DSY76_03560 [Bacteroidota bacterium]